MVRFQPGCCEADFGSRIKIWGYPLGRSASFFVIHLFRLVPDLKIDFFEKLPQVSRVAEMVAAKNCSNFWGEKIVQTSGAQIQANCPRMLRGRFWLENQDFGVSVGAIGIIFRDTSFPTSPGSQNRLFRKIALGVQGRRNGRGKKCLHFWGPNPSKVAKNVARPILARESRL